MKDREARRSDLFAPGGEGPLAGRPIVPLFGAGISAGAGIPTVPQIEEYLVKLSLLQRHDPRQHQRTDRIVDAILAHGWPSRHQVNLDVHLLARRLDKPLAHLLQHERERAYAGAIVHELNGPSPTAAALYSRLALGTIDARSEDASPSFVRQARSVLSRHRDWRALLDFIASGDRSLKESFFDRLVRDRRPAMAHRFIAFLARYYDWKLILTTNFDDLIETALRDEGLQPVVYELQTGSALPDPQLVRGHLSLVKLHGGAFALRAGFDLEHPMDENELAVFRQYFPREALMLVLGYSGSDRRVMSLVEAIAAPAVTRPKVPRVFWVYRHRLPSNVAQARLVAERQERQAFLHHPYGDAALFLSELYTHETYLHPVTSTSYLAMPVVPLPPDPLDTLSDNATISREARFFYDPAGEYADASLPSDFVDQSRLDAVRVTIIESRTGVASSRALAAHVRALETRNYQSLWINCNGIRSSDTLLSIFAAEFSRYDPTLPPLVSALDFGSADVTRREHAINVAQHWISRAAARGRYVLAFDAVTDFARFHLADPLLSTNRPGHGSDETFEALAFYDLLAALIGAVRHGQFGESVIAMAGGFVRQSIRRSPVEAQPALIPHRHPRLPIPPHPTDRATLSTIVLHARERSLTNEPWIRVRIVGPPLDTEVATPVQISALVETNRSSDVTKLAEAVFVVSLASGFRRPTSKVALARTALRLLEEERPQLPGVRTEFQTAFLKGWDELRQVLGRAADPKTTRALGDDTRSVTTLRTRLDRMVTLACKTEINLARPAVGEPALVEMDGGFIWMPLDLRDEIYRTFSTGFSDLLSPLHKALAAYYLYDLYEPSRDIRAFFEFLFHATVHAVTEPDLQARHLAFRWIRGALDRERRYLVGNGFSGTLACTLERISTRMSLWPHDTEALALQHEVETMQALALREVGNVARSLSIRNKQIDTYLLATGVRSNPSQTVEHLLLMIERDALLCLSSDSRSKGLDGLRRAAEQIKELARLSVTESERAKLTRLEIRSGLHRIAGILRQIEGVADTPGDRPGTLCEIERLRKTADEVYHRVDFLLTYHSGSRGGRYKCYLRCFGARLQYLRSDSPNFDRAYELLNEAQAAVGQATLPNDRLALAVSHLHLGELAIESAVAMNEPKRSTVTDERASALGIGSPQQSASAKPAGRLPPMLLEKARGALDQAQRLLRDDLRSAEWWTWLYLLQAKLGVEMLSLDPHDDIGRTSAAESEMDRDAVLLAVLTAIGAGLAAIPDTDERHCELRILWLELYACFRRKNHSDARWEEVCERLGLLPEWRHQTFPSDMAAGPNPEGTSS